MQTYSLQPDGSYLVTAGMMVDGDGSPRCYAPAGSGLDALDYLANAGHPGNWWALACHKDGRPYIQGTDAPLHDPATKGFYVSMTSYYKDGPAENDTARYVNAELEAYVVVPRKFQQAVPGIVLGCKVIVTHSGKSCEAVVADIGPDFGEASIACAHLVGVPGSPKSGGVTHGVTYRIWPGVAATGYRLQKA